MVAGVTVLVWSQQSIISKPLLYSSLKLSGPNTSEGKQKDKLMNPYMWNVKTLLLNSCLDNTHGHKNKQTDLLKLWNHKKKSDVCYSVFWGFGCTLRHHRNKWHFICFSFTAFCLQCLGVIFPPYIYNYISKWNAKHTVKINWHKVVTRPLCLSYTVVEQ